MRFGVGQSVHRKEDPKFLTGRGKYVDDIVLPRMTHAVFVFSPVAHADIKNIDISAAEAAPGVVCVLTGKDYVDDGMGPLMPGMMPEDMGGPKGYRSPRWPMPGPIPGMRPRARTAVPTRGRAVRARWWRSTTPPSSCCTRPPRSTARRDRPIPSPT